MISAGSAVSDSRTAPSTELLGFEVLGRRLRRRLRCGLAMAIGVVESRSAIGALGGSRGAFARFLRRVALTKARGR